MTRNQISYWQLQEDRRANIERERETRRHNIESESFNLLNLRETRRHNMAIETLNQGNLDESVRHNRATEYLSAQTLAETQRHNLAGEAAALRGQDLDYQARKYAADTSAAATRYSAELSSSATKYAASLNYSASIYATDQNRAQREVESRRDLLLGLSQVDQKKAELSEATRHNQEQERINNASNYLKNAQETQKIELQRQEQARKDRLADLEVYKTQQELLLKEREVTAKEAGSAGQLARGLGSLAILFA